MSFDIEHIITTYQPSIFKTCLGFTSHLEDAKDLTQEVLINVWRGLPQFNQQASLKTWIYRITVNTCLMYKRKKRLPLQAIPEGNEAIFGQVQNESFQREEVELLYKAIAQLSEKERLITLLYLEDLPYKTIAEIIGISTNLVGVSINRIKKKLASYGRS